MSTSTFLQKMRKGDLYALSESLGLNGDGMKKTQLEVLIEDHLSTHGELASDSRYAAYYKRRLAEYASPVKREAGAAVDGVMKSASRARRRVTQAVDEVASAVSESDIEQPLTRARDVAVRTPARVSALASSIPLPPSPSIVTDAIERRTHELRTQLSTVVHNTGVFEAAESTRASLSSVVSVEALTLLFEAYNLRPEILADRYAFTLPIIPFLTSSPHAVQLPDLFLLLTGRFWSPFLLWAATSFFVPLVAAWLFNLTSRARRSGGAQFRYQFDPLTFNIVKAILAYAVYARDVEFGGLVDLESVARVRSAMAGGWQGLVANAAIGVLVTFYEAIISK